MTPQEVVAGFIAAIESRDVDAALAFLAADVSYENMPMDPIVGREMTGVVLHSYLDLSTEVEWRIVREVLDGDVVINERVDRFHIGDGWLELPVAGFWEVRDGLVTLWRDYFDMSAYTSQLDALVGDG
ncbi:MAG: limonene-1,2-epoxide hydrolase family protein [Acidimicrobiales bacterium]